MRKVILSACLAMLSMPVNVSASAFDDHLLQANLGFYTDYRQYGRTQTGFTPTFQGELAYFHIPSGLYIGVWGSGAHWIGASFEEGSGSTESRMFFGRMGRLDNTNRYDIGVTRIVYVGSKVPGFGELTGAEGYVRLEAGGFYVKYTHSLTDRPGVRDSRHSGNLEVGLDMDLSQWTQMNASVGFDHLRAGQGKSHSGLYWKAGVARFVDGPNFWVGMDITQSNVSSDSVGGRTGSGKSTGSIGPVFYFTKNF